MSKPKALLLTLLLFVAAMNDVSLAGTPGAFESGHCNNYQQQSGSGNAQYITGSVSSGSWITDGASYRAPVVFRREPPDLTPSLSVERHALRQIMARVNRAHARLSSGRAPPGCLSCF
jgi:hypothetical protein